MSGFDWRTDGEDSWEQPQPPNEPKDARRNGRPWLFVLLGVFGLAVAGSLIARQVDERVEEATVNTTADLLSTVNLVRTAVLNDDSEIFHSMLSGRDDTWTESQQTLFDEGMLLGRSFLGLDLVLEDDALAPLSDGDPDLKSIEFSPELNEAIVTTELSYQLSQPQVDALPVRLERVSVYRRGGVRWLLAPPLGEFWGKRIREIGDWVTLDYPERDADVAARLAGDLDQKVGQMCRQIEDLNCAADFHLSIRLLTSPDSLIMSAHPDNPFRSSDSIVLPSLTLVGMPLDEAGYQALLQAYASRVVSAAIPELVGWGCCSRALIAGALVDYQLSRLDLFNWPVSNDTYERIAREGLAFVEIARFWRSVSRERLSGPDGWQIYALIDFLINRFADTSPVEMLRAIDDSSSWTSWLLSFAGGVPFLGREHMLETLNEDWWRRTEGIVATHSEPPVPWPAQSVTLMCNSDAAQSQRTIRLLNLPEFQWAESTLGEGIIMRAGPMFGDQDILTSSFVYDEEMNREAWQATMWRAPGPEMTLGLADYEVTLGQTDPDGAFVVVYNLNDQGVTAASLVEIASCLAGDCSPIQLPGLPVWSPTGDNLLMLEEVSLAQMAVVAGEQAYLLQSNTSLSGIPILRADLSAGYPDSIAGAKLVGVGQIPFWLGDDAYGFVRYPPSQGVRPTQEVVIASVGDDAARLAFTVDEIEDGLASMGVAGHVTFQHLAANPAFPDLIFLVVETTDGRLQILSYNLESGEILVRMHMASGAGVSFSFSPDNQRLLVTGPLVDELGHVENQGLLYLNEIVDNETMVFSIYTGDAFFPQAYDWSANGEWLAIASSARSITLYAPEHKFQRMVVRETGDCPSLAWISR